jgi:hypothetical protein
VAEVACPASATREASVPNGTTSVARKPAETRKRRPSPGRIADLSQSWIGFTQDHTKFIRDLPRLAEVLREVTRPL